jgi:hypothetical protein
MHKAICHLKSVSPYSQSRHHSTPKLAKENDMDYELRTWMNRLHVENGHVIIPPMAFSNCIKEAAQFLSIKIPGKSNSTYTKHFESGVLVVEALVLPIKPASVKGEELFLNADGKRGGGKRVTRFYPRIDSWEGTVEFLSYDDEVTESVFRKVLDAAGNLIGIGRFRPRNRGYYGRFEVKSLKWVNL